MAGEPFTKDRQVGVARKRYRRVVVSRKGWEKLQDERQGPCLVCRHLGRTQLLASTLHHVVPRSRGGDDAAVNLVPLCGDGTRGHHGDVEARTGLTSRWLAEAVQQYEPAVYAYAVEKLGEDGWLRLMNVTFDEASNG